MRFAHFFVDRPIFASVTSIIFLILGYVSYESLPVAQYPEIVPPTVVVRASYPGANAETVAATIATPIEQEVNGVDNMLYMTSLSTNDGNMQLTVHLQGRHQPRYRQRAGSEPPFGGAAASSAGRAQPRRHGA